MDSGAIAAIFGAIAGAITGVIASVIAPWVHWGIDKRRQKHTERKHFLSLLRTDADGETFSPRLFARTARFERARPFLRANVVTMVEHYEHDVELQRFPDDYADDIRRAVLADIARLEREWELL